MTDQVQEGGKKAQTCGISFTNDPLCPVRNVLSQTSKTKSNFSPLKGMVFFGQSKDLPGHLDWYLNPHSNFESRLYGMIQLIIAPCVGVVCTTIQCISTMEIDNGRNNHLSETNKKLDGVAFAKLGFISEPLFCQLLQLSCVYSMDISTTGFQK